MRASAFLESPESIQIGFGIGKEDPAHLGQVRLPPSQLQQLDPKLLLESAHGVADRGLRAAELFGCGSKAAQLDDRPQDLPFVESRFHEREYIEGIDGCELKCAFTSAVAKRSMHARSTTVDQVSRTRERTIPANG